MYLVESEGVRIARFDCIAIKLDRLFTKARISTTSQIRIFYVVCETIPNSQIKFNSKIPAEQNVLVQQLINNKFLGDLISIRFLFISI